MSDPKKKMKTVPNAWKSRPDSWWRHVELCSSCSQNYERPDTTEEPKPCR